MGLNDILKAVHKLDLEEVIILRTKIEKLQTSYVDPGVSDEQLASVMRTQQLMDEGKMETRPARAVMAEILKKYR